MVTCRVFKIDCAWSYLILYIPENIKYIDLKNDNNINKIKKYNYIGKFEIPIDILKLYHFKNNYYYIINLND